MSVWRCYCNLEMALRQMPSDMDQWQPQHSHSSRGHSRRTRVGRQIGQSVASGVCFLRPRLLKCMLSWTFFLSGVQNAAATKLIVRPERSNHKDGLGKCGLVTAHVLFRKTHKNDFTCEYDCCFPCLASLQVWTSAGGFGL